nr:MAG TPA: hypothetical protein [Caudoviricetes sp.]
MRFCIMLQIYNKNPLLTIKATDYFCFLACFSFRGS